jgi:hypothetical protein
MVVKGEKLGQDPRIGQYDGKSFSGEQYDPANSIESA